jgi:hypothetical protein
MEPLPLLFSGGFEDRGSLAQFVPDTNSVVDLARHKITTRKWKEFGQPLPHKSPGSRISARWSGVGSNKIK